jgi:hypothetical protein
MHRVVAIVSIACGLGLIAVPFATSLFDRTRGAERTFDAMRETVSEPGIAVARRNFGVVRAGGTEFLDKAVPRLAARLDMTPDEFQALLASDFPRVARGAQSIPGYLQFVGPTIDALDANRAEFDNADSLPGAGLPITSAPWLILLLGGGFVAAGAVALRGGTLLPVGALAVAAVAVPLALGIPGKAQDARTVGDIARGGLSAQGAATAGEIVDVLDGMVEETRGALVPELARRLGVSSSAVDDKLARDFPATHRLLDRWDAIAAGPTGAELAAKQQAAVDDFAAADETPVLELPWLVIGPGGLLLVLSAGALALSRGGARTRKMAPLREASAA